MRLGRFVLPLALLLCTFTPNVHANTISGFALCSLSSVDANNTPTPGATLASGTLCATFQSSAIA